MHTTNIRQDLIEKLAQLNSSHQYLYRESNAHEDWANLHESCRQRHGKLVKSAKRLSAIAYACVAITIGVCVVKLLDSSAQWPALTTAAFFVLLTVGNLFYALAQRLTAEKLRQEILILQLLEKIDMPRPDKAFYFSQTSQHSLQ